MSTPLHVLILEDQPADVELTVYMLRQAGFDPNWHSVYTREDYLAALSPDLDIILADYTLPQFDALTALQLLQEKGLDIPFIVVSGTISEEVAVNCMKLGAADYLLKDRLTRLGPAIEHALEQKQLEKEQRSVQQQLTLLSTAVEQSTEGVAVSDMEGTLLFVNLAWAQMHGYNISQLEKKDIRILHARDQIEAFNRAHNQVSQIGQFSGEIFHIRKNGTIFPSQSHISILRDENANPIGMIHTVRDITEQKQAEDRIQSLLKDLQSFNQDLAHAYDATLEGWVRFLDLRDEETEGHTKRVTEISIELAKKMGFHPDDLIHVRRGALLHDIGKMGIPDEILRKPGPLSDDEWIIMKRHPVYAYQMLSPIEFLRPSLDIPYYHHEKWDGSGYPKNLGGDEIPLAARLFAIVDVWDALNSDRPYRKAWPKEKILDYIQTESGKHFDPGVVNQFLSLMNGKLK